MAHVSEADRDALRACMPQLLEARFGVRDVRRSFRCPSPAHDDRDPSAHYYPDAHTVHCFGCGRTWDVFSLLGEVDGLAGFPEQAQAVADAVGYRLGEGALPPLPPRPARPPAPPFELPRPAGAQDVSAACVRAYEELYRPAGEVGRRYLRWRGLDDDDIQRFGLGFCRVPAHVMPQFRVYEREALGFVVIPFWDRECHEARYAMCRTVSRGEVRCKEWRPKGLVSPLWGEWKLCRGLDVVLVAEGLIDAMVLEKVTGRPVVALGGVANATRLAGVLYHEPASLRPRKVVVCMDEDAEGHKARDRIRADLARIGIPHAALPPYPGGAKDADEWLMAGRHTAWDYERHGGGPLGPGPFYRTRWADGER